MKERCQNPCDSRKKQQHAKPHEWQKRRGWVEVTREKKHSARLVDQVSYLDSVCPKPSNPKEMWAPIQQLVKPHAQPTTSMQSQSHTSKPTYILVELYLITHTHKFDIEMKLFIISNNHCTYRYACYVFPPVLPIWMMQYLYPYESDVNQFLYFL